MFHLSKQLQNTSPPPPICFKHIYLKSQAPPPPFYMSILTVCQQMIKLWWFVKSDFFGTPFIVLQTSILICYHPFFNCIYRHTFFATLVRESVGLFCLLLFIIYSLKITILQESYKCNYTYSYFHGNTLELLSLYNCTFN